MSNKLIIIHGVDVTDCNYLHTSVFNEEAALCDIALQVGQDCINTPNCYYKQLKRKEEECEELKEEKENYCFTCDVAERMRKVTYAATGGRLSYANYTVEAIEQAYQDQLNYQVEQETKELTEELQRKEQECEELKKYRPIIDRLLKQFETYDKLKSLDVVTFAKQVFDQLDQLKTENEKMSKGYMELTEIVSPYIDAFTGYNEELQGFDIVLCVKELVQQLNDKDNSRITILTAINDQLKEKCDKIDATNERLVREKYDLHQDILQLKEENVNLRFNLSKSYTKEWVDEQIRIKKIYEADRQNYWQALQEIKEIAEEEVECKIYEIENDCFNETRCKALNEHIDFTKQILQKCEVINEK